MAQPYEPKISSKPLLHKLIKKALEKTPGSADLIAKHFDVKHIQTTMKPPKPKNLVYHSGYGTV